MFTDSSFVSNDFVSLLYSLIFWTDFIYISPRKYLKHDPIGYVLHWNRRTLSKEKTRYKYLVEHIEQSSCVKITAWILAFVEISWRDLVIAFLYGCSCKRKSATTVITVAVAYADAWKNGLFLGFGASQSHQLLVNEMMNGHSFCWHFSFVHLSWKLIPYTHQCLSTFSQCELHTFFLFIVVYVNYR